MHAGKSKSAGTVSGCPKKLANLIRAGRYSPSTVCEMEVSELRAVCSDADIAVGIPTTTVLKNNLFYSSVCIDEI